LACQMGAIFIEDHGSSSSMASPLASTSTDSCLHRGTDVY
jgi:hypothetical protein